MNKLILLVHSSEIIRKGLTAILRTFFNVEVIQAENVNELTSLKDLKNHLIVCVLEKPEETGHELMQLLNSNNQINFIGFNGTIQSDATESSDFKYYMNQNTPSFEIQKIFSTCLKLKEKPVKATDNDELTAREKDVLKLVALGYSNKSIADQLFISVHTVISHRKNITEKTGIKSISGLTVYSILNNLIDTGSINPKDLI